MEQTWEFILCLCRNGVFEEVIRVRWMVIPWSSDKGGPDSSWKIPHVFQTQARDSQWNWMIHSILCNSTLSISIVQIVRRYRFKILFKTSWLDDASQLNMLASRWNSVQCYTQHPWYDVTMLWHHYLEAVPSSPKRIFNSLPIFRNQDF